VETAEGCFSHAPVTGYKRSSMKGIIFNLLEGYLISISGDDGFEKILQQCTLKTTDPLLIVAPGTYPDADFLEIVRAAATGLQVPEAEFFRNFGRYAIPRMAERYPNFFTPFTGPKDFLKYIGMVHLVEIKKIFLDAKVPDFSFQDTGPNELIFRYSSRRRLCHMVEGLIEGLAAYYKVKVSYRQPHCLIKGDEVCEFHIRFQDASKTELIDEQGLKSD